MRTRRAKQAKGVNWVKSGQHVDLNFGPLHLWVFALRFNWLLISVAARRSPRLALASILFMRINGGTRDAFLARRGLGRFDSGTGLQFILAVHDDAFTDV